MYCKQVNVIKANGSHNINLYRHQGRNIQFFLGKAGDGELTLGGLELMLKIEVSSCLHCYEGKR